MLQSAFPYTCCRLEAVESKSAEEGSSRTAGPHRPRRKGAGVGGCAAALEATFFASDLARGNLSSASCWCPHTKNFQHSFQGGPCKSCDLMLPDQNWAWKWVQFALGAPFSILLMTHMQEEDHPSKKLAATWGCAQCICDCASMGKVVFHLLPQVPACKNRYQGLGMS